MSSHRLEHVGVLDGLNGHVLRRRVGDRPMARRVFKQRLLLWKVALSSLLVVTGCSLLSAEYYVLPSESMEPTIKKGERVAIRMLDGCETEFQHGDVVFFETPPRLVDTILLLKRVVGLEGETVELRNRVLYVDEQPQQDVYANYDAPELSDPDFGPYQVRKGHIFVLGDNRNRSADSRHFGNVPCGLVKGEWIPRR